MAEKIHVPPKAHTSHPHSSVANQAWQTVYHALCRNYTFGAIMLHGPLVRSINEYAHGVHIWTFGFRGLYRVHSFTP